MSALTRLFNEHPSAVDETYAEHMRFAGRFSGKLFLAAFAALVHAFLPFLFETSASRIVRDLHERTQKRR